MTYRGLQADIKIGRGGLMTDVNPVDIPNFQIIDSENIEIKEGRIEKDSGSRKWNLSALSAGIIEFLDWFPEPHLQRFIIATRDGKLFKMPNPETQTQITPFALTDPQVLNTSLAVSFVTGGSEISTNDPKIFIFTGNDQMQRISADASTYTTISKPAADWVPGNFPKGGIIHRDRLWAFIDHRIYASDPDDQEDFQSGNFIQFPIAPGQGEGLEDLIVYKGRLFAFKKPVGVYFLVDDDTDPLNWFFKKLQDEFGIGGPSASVQALDDLLISNASGGITSLKATDKLGEVEAGDIFRVMRVEDFVRTQMSIQDINKRRAIYYEERKIAFFAYRSSGGIQNDRIFKIDLSKQLPALTIITKDQANCFAHRSQNFRKKPFYGSEDGFLYEMDRSDRNVAGIGYTGMFQTPHINFAFMESQLKVSLGEVNKIFDSLEISFIPTGRWNVSIEYFIDGMFVETITAEVSKGPVLDDFFTDNDRLTPKAPRTVVKKLRGSGRTISFRIFNSGTDENFKITNLRVKFRPSNQDEKGRDSGRVT